MFFGYLPVAVASRILSDTDTGVSPASGNSVALPAADNGCDVARPKLPGQYRVAIQCLVVAGPV